MDFGDEVGVVEGNGRRWGGDYGGFRLVRGKVGGILELVLILYEKVSWFFEMWLGVVMERFNF